MSKTTRQWLSQLKDEHRDLAIANADPAHIDNLPIEGGTLSAVLSFAFNWSDSPEGHSFWSNIHNKLLSDTYFDVPQQTPESCKAKAKEVMYGKPLPTDAAKRKEYVIYQVEVLKKIITELLEII
jgi:hypothetical protein